MSDEINTFNDSLIAVQGENIIMLRPRLIWTKEEALRCAAYIVAMADDNNTFMDLLMAVKNT